MDTLLWILFLIVAVPVGLYLLVSYCRRAARRAELRQPSTTGDIRALSADIGAVEMEVSDVSSSVTGIPKELGNLHISVSGIQEELEALHIEVTDVVTGPVLWASSREGRRVAGPSSECQAVRRGVRPRLPGSRRCRCWPGTASVA